VIVPFYARASLIKKIYNIESWHQYLKIYILSHIRRCKQLSVFEVGFNFWGGVKKYGLSGKNAIL